MTQRMILAVLLGTTVCWAAGAATAATYTRTRTAAKGQDWDFYLGVSR